MINPVWLRTFCTLVEVGHFTRTAQQLHMTQSGVSQHIHKLEEQLEQLLLARDGKQFTLTQAGERLYEQGRSILMSLSNLEQRVAFDPPHEGLVRIMSPGSVGLKLYPELIRQQQAHPKLVMDYRFAPNASVEKAIVQGEVDMGFMTRPSQLTDVACERVAQEPLLLVTPKDVDTPNWSTLMTLGFIDHPDGAHHAQLLLGENYPQFQHSNEFTKTGFSNQIHLILEPVSLGLGFTVLPKYAVDAFQSQHYINVHRLNKPVSETLYLCTRKHKACSQRVENVMAHATQYLSKK
ncbi:MAG: LysR family transcriptional regulator [Bermanella sp.]|nr:LysR family transcriptional regulator [Bermanella sp.]|tara:strand:+ start:1810 stop:2688 length:879 start_codon:yes stop_codon:yes gene_type:complete